ncbi:MAG: hypothetical protein RIQ52_625, partial [Pseudomonadota bacterium]
MSLQRYWDMTPAETMALVRSVAGMLLISLAAVTLNMPSHTALACALFMTATSTMPDASQATGFVIRLVIDVTAGVLLSEVTLALWTDQPWFALPFAALVFMTLFYYGKLPGGNMFPVVFFIVAVFYAPVSVESNVYSALDNIVIILLVAAVILLTHVAFWPRRPLLTMHLQMSERLETLAYFLEHTGAFAGKSLSPGQLSTRLDTLKTAARAHTDIPALQAHYQAVMHATEHMLWLLHWQGQQTASQNRSAAPEAWRCELADYFRKVATAIRLWHVDGVPVPSPPTPALAESDTATEAMPQLQSALRALEKTLADLFSQPHPSERLAFSLASEIPGMAWIRADFWRQPAPVPYYFGLKYALGAMICLFVIQALEWQGIDTAMVTCMVIAQTSLGADYRKSLHRIGGALIGGVLVVVYTVVMLPALETIAGFLLAITPAYIIASRLLVNARISYVGIQTGYAFASVALLSPGPVIDLIASRDRVLGIFIGICVMGILDYLVWPQSAARQIQLAMARGLAALASAATTNRQDPEKLQILLEQTDRELRTASDWHQQSVFEPLSAKHRWLPADDLNHRISIIHQL